MTEITDAAIAELRVKAEKKIVSSDAGHYEARTILSLLSALEASRAEAARLREAIQAADDAFTFEINPSNYTHDQVCELNSQMIEATAILRKALEVKP